MCFRDYQVLRIANVRSLESLAFKEVRELSDAGKERGFLTTSEIVEGLKGQKLSSDQVDGVFVYLSEEGIEIVDESEEDEEARPERAKPVKGAPEAAYTGPQDDPVRMYLKEIGKPSKRLYISFLFLEWGNL